MTSKGTVLRISHEGGVSMCHQPMAADEHTVVSRLYGLG